MLRKYFKKLRNFYVVFQTLKDIRFSSVVCLKISKYDFKILVFSPIFLHNFYLYSFETLFLLLNITTAQAAMLQAAISRVMLLRNKLN